MPAALAMRLRLAAIEGGISASTLAARAIAHGLDEAVRETAREGAP